MRSRITTAAAAAACLAIGTGLVLSAGTSAQAAANPPWEPDHSAVGTITFYDAAGHVIRSGRTDAAPFFAYAAGSKSLRTGDTNAKIMLATPAPNTDPSAFFRDQVSSATAYPLTAGPAAVKSLSQSEPVATGSSSDLAVDDYLAETQVQTDPAYKDIYQVRLVTDDGHQNTLTYGVADILVDPANHTWSQVYPASAPPRAHASAFSIGKNTAITYGKKVTLTGKLTDSVTHAGIGRAAVKLYSKPAGTKSFSLVKSLTTGSTGAVSFGAQPKVNTVYHWVYGGTSAHKAATSTNQAVSVAQAVTAAVRGGAAKRNVTFPVYGTVGPNETGKMVVLQQKVGSRWKNTTHQAKVRMQRLPDGRRALGYVITLKERKAGKYTFRATRASTSVNAAGVSNAAVKTVK
jgi:hypothetical protein